MIETFLGEGMHKIHHTRVFSISRINSIQLFIHFVGHLSHTIKEALFRRATISWFNLWAAMYHSGAKIIIPIILVSTLIGVSLVTNIYNTLLNVANLPQRVLYVSQDILLNDVLPCFIGLTLALQWALNIISIEQRSPISMLQVYIIPIMLAFIVCAPLIYVYSVNVIYISIYFCFKYYLRIDFHQYFSQIINSFTNLVLIRSIIKTTIYCTIVSLTVGYNYYAVAFGFIPQRIAMSRILSRSLIYLLLTTILTKLFAQ